MRRILKVTALIVLGFSLRVAQVEVTSLYIAYQFVGCLEEVGLDLYTLQVCDMAVAQQNQTLIRSVGDLGLSEAWATPKLKELAKRSR
jgi:hypothetical protein